MLLGWDLHWQRAWLFCMAAACAPQPRLPMLGEAGATNASVRAGMTRGDAGSGGTQSESPRPSGGSPSSTRASAEARPVTTSGGAPNEVSTISTAGRGNAQPEDGSRTRSWFDACHSTNVPDCPGAPANVACPRRFRDVAVGELCGIEGRTRAPNTCNYPEGVCSCRTVPYCGGAAPTYLQKFGMRWACALPPKPGDCPVAVANGARCAIDGQRCSTGSCGSATECVCESHRLRCVTRILPTPPGAHAGMQPSHE